MTSLASFRSFARHAAAAALSVLLVACGDHAELYAVGGTVSGLAPGESVSLRLNGASQLAVSQNGPFTFLGGVHHLARYEVTVVASPAGKSCGVTGGQGAEVIGSIANVQVQCVAPSYKLGGSVSGLLGGQSVVLQNNGGDPLTVAADGPYTFAQPVTHGGAYSVTVASQPRGQTCTVSNYAGAGVTADVGDVAVVCAGDTFSVSGSASGLGGSSAVTLNINGADPVVVAADGSFGFPARIAYGGTYTVTVAQQPSDRTCTVTNGSGAGVVANVSDVRVDCAVPTHTISGRLQGLGAGLQVTLMNSGADPVTLSANGAFAFPTPVAHGGGYAVTVSTQPTGQTCAVSSGSGAGVTGDIATVQVTCAAQTFPVNVQVLGLGAGGRMTLLNNGADPLTITSNGSAQFTRRTPYGGSYAVTIGTAPVGQACTVSRGSGSNVTNTVVGITVLCSTVSYSVGGTLSGLNPGEQITLLNNGANATVLNANGTFTFSSKVAYGTPYAVTVGAQPQAQSCAVRFGSASSIAGNVGGVDVNCASAYAYVLNWGDQTLSTYTLGINGQLTAPAVPVAAIVQPGSTIGTHPSGRHLYVSNAGANTVSQYDVQPDGHPTPMAPVDRVPSGANPSAMVVDATGSYAYVSNSDDDSISQYSIGSDGSLTPLTPALSGSGGANPADIAIDPTGLHAYVLNLSGGVAQFAIASDGTLNAIPGVSNADAGYLPTGMIFDPTGRYAFTLVVGGTLSSFSFDTRGALVPGASVGACKGVATLDTTGRFVYVSCQDQNKVLAFQIGAGGVLSPVTGQPTGAAPIFVTTMKGY